MFPGGSDGFSTTSVILSEEVTATPYRLGSSTLFKPNVLNSESTIDFKSVLKIVSPRQIRTGSSVEDS
jgi:hypothetical protein